MNASSKLIFKLLVFTALFGLVLWALQRSELGTLLTFENLVAKRDSLQAEAATHPIQFVAGFSIIYVLVTAAAIPGATILTLAGGAIFGLGKGLLIVSFASTIGATLSFLITRYLLRATVEAKFKIALEKINEGLTREGTTYLLTLRLIPVFPFFLVNLLLGLTKLSTLKFAVVSQLGMLPGTFFYVNAGTQIATLNSASEVLSPAVLSSLVALGLFPMITSFLLRLYRRKKAYRGFKKPKRFDFNVAVIGGGAGGLVTSYIASAAKAKVALIEEHRMGGDCLYTGCVPSKALLQSAKIANEIANCTSYGIEIDQATKTVNFPRVMERVREKIRAIEPHDSIERYTKLGVDCFTGRAKLLSPWEIEISGTKKQVIRARSIVIATGAAPVIPEINGLSECRPLVSETIWQLQALPQKLLILGGGPIGCEMATAFARLGSDVTLVERGPALLGREDADVSHAIQLALKENDVSVRLETEIARFDTAPKRAFTLKGEVIEFDEVFVALGRRARTSDMGLDRLGIETEVSGTIARNGILQTAMPNVFVCGDVAGPWQFTHTAAHQAWYAAVNALLDPFWSFKVDDRVIPAVTYTDPEVARVGINEREAKAANIEFEVTRYELDDLDRAIVDSKAKGFVKVITPPQSDRILGATVVGANAGEILAEFTLAMKHGLGLGRILSTIHPYPTYSEATKFAAGAWRKAHTPRLALEIGQRLFRYLRK